MFARWKLCVCVAVSCLFLPLGAQARDVADLALSFLRLQGVPCERITHTDRWRMGAEVIATCEDGRRWALFFIEGDVAFVQPRTNAFYRWRRDTYLAYPELYAAPKLGPEDQLPAGD
jgi:hypothetical protein